MERSRDRLSLFPVSDALGSETRRGVQLAFIGNPSAKKYVYADMLSKLLQVPHISMATLVRQELSLRSSPPKRLQMRLIEEKLFGRI